MYQGSEERDIEIDGERKSKINRERKTGETWGRNNEGFYREVRRKHAHFEGDRQCIFLCYFFLMKKFFRSKKILTECGPHSPTRNQVF